MGRWGLLGEGRSLGIQGRPAERVEEGALQEAASAQDCSCLLSPALGPRVPSPPALGQQELLATCAHTVLSFVTGALV